MIISSSLSPSLYFKIKNGLNLKFQKLKNDMYYILREEYN